MRTRWALLFALPFAVGVASGCGGSDGAYDDRRAQRAPTAAPESPAQPTVALSGCIQTGPGTQRYLLQNVRVEGSQPQSPQASTTRPAPVITEGASVELAGDQDFSSLAGQRVKLTAVITDPAENTIGTAGTSGTPTTSGDRSQAASSADYPDKVKAEAGRIARESMADGSRPVVRVQEVQSTGERCRR